MDSSNLAKLAPVFERLFGPLDAATLARLVERMAAVQVERGEALYREGDRADGLHVVLTGRLEVRVTDDSGRERAVATLGPGDTVGEIALFTGGERGAHVVAVRDSMLGELSREEFEATVARDPSALAATARFIIARLAESQRRGGRSEARKRETVALVPLDASVPLGEFARRLELALLPFGRTSRVDEHAIRARLPEAFGEGVTEGDEIAVGRYLDAIEERTDYLLLECGVGAGAWNDRALGYADRVLLVGHAASPRAATWFEEELVAAMRAGARPVIELVLVHPDDRELPATTREWLSLVTADRHFHLPWRGNAGINRLARLLSGRAVTVVLGGGGARGFAHVGVVRALREIGIPIDAIGGTSFGGVVAAMVALGFSDARILEEFKVGFADNRPMDDYTLPVVSLVRGEKLVAALRRAYGASRIEDMWLPFFAVSSSLSRNRMKVHERGEVWRAVRATVSLPAILPPFIDEGELLVDGAILNNLPVEVMRDRIRGRIIAVDLSVDDEYELTRERMPTVWEYLRAKFLPYGKPIAVPTLHEVIVQSTTLTSRREVEAARRDADLYLNPPVGRFELLDWSRFHDIVEAGYAHAIERAGAWAALNRDCARRDEFFDSRERRGPDPTTIPPAPG